MAIWSMWLDGIAAVLALLAHDVGLGVGPAIIAATVLIRLALLPIVWPVAVRNYDRQRKMANLRPELDRLKERYADKPELYMQKMSELYAKHGLSPVDGRGLLGSLAQMPVLLGMVNVLRNLGEGGRFLWIQNLMRPDAVLAVIAGLSTGLLTLINPNVPEHMRLMLMLLPTAFAIFMAFQFSSALAIYWATSNTFSAAQTLALHRMIRRRERSRH